MNLTFLSCRSFFNTTLHPCLGQSFAEQSNDMEDAASTAAKLCVSGGHPSALKKGSELDELRQKLLALCLKAERAYLQARFVHAQSKHSGLSAGLSAEVQCADGTSSSGGSRDLVAQPGQVLNAQQMTGLETDVVLRLHETITSAIDNCVQPLPQIAVAAGEGSCMLGNVKALFVSIHCILLRRAKLSCRESSLLPTRRASNSLGVVCDV